MPPPPSRPRLVVRPSQPPLSPRVSTRGPAAQPMRIVLFLYSQNKQCSPSRSITIQVRVCGVFGKVPPRPRPPIQSAPFSPKSAGHLKVPPICFVLSFPV